MEKEVNYKIFLIAIIAIVVIVLISNNFNDITGNVARDALGGLDYCKNKLCSVGEGDCDSDLNKEIIDCKSGLVCKSNVGANYGWSRIVDVCEMPTTTEPTKREPECTVGGYRCEKDSSGQYTGWAQKCYDSSKGWENTEYCKNGCDGSTGQCIKETPPVPQLRNCYLGQDCFLNTGDKTLIMEKTVKLVTVYSNGAIDVDVDGVQKTISLYNLGENVNGLEIRRKETYYDPNNKAASAATIIIFQVVQVQREVSYQGVLEMLNKCIVVDSGALTGNEVCKSWGKTCIFSIMRMKRIQDFSEYINKLVDCNTKPNEFDLRDSDDFNVLCCSAP